MTAAYRTEIFRPHPVALDSLVCSGGTSATPPSPERIHDMLRGSRHGSFALILRIDAAGEHVLERWRVDARGRVLRSRYCILEEELDQRDETDLGIPVA